MSHNFLSLAREHFDVRTAFGGCLINIGGETVECEVTKSRPGATYTVTRKDTGAELCTFRPYHLWGTGMMYQIDGASHGYGSATLIVPQHGLLERGDDESADGEGLEDEAAIAG
jgi:hypothetical protein